MVDLRNVLAALETVAPAFARTRGRDPSLGPMDAITPIVEAVDLVRTSRREKQPVEQMLWQTGMFGETSEDAGPFAICVGLTPRSGLA